MESIKTILADLKEFHKWESTWKETQHKLADREKQLATEYAAYSLDVRQELMDKPMSYEEWYKTTKLEE